MDPSSTCLSKACAVRLLALDVDGILSDGRLYYGANDLELKTFHTRDGLGIKMLMSTGVSTMPAKLTRACASSKSLQRVATASWTGYAWIREKRAEPHRILESV